MMPQINLSPVHHPGSLTSQCCPIRGSEPRIMAVINNDKDEDPRHAASGCSNRGAAIATTATAKQQQSNSLSNSNFWAAPSQQFDPPSQVDII